MIPLFIWNPILSMFIADKIAFTSVKYNFNVPIDILFIQLIFMPRHMAQRSWKHFVFIPALALRKKFLPLAWRHEFHAHVVSNPPVEQSKEEERQIVIQITDPDSQCGRYGCTMSQLLTQHSAGRLCEMQFSPLNMLSHAASPCHNTLLAEVAHLGNLPLLCGLFVHLPHLKNRNPLFTCPCVLERFFH